MKTTIKIKPRSLAQLNIIFLMAHHMKLTWWELFEDYLLDNGWLEIRELLGQAIKDHNLKREKPWCMPWLWERNSIVEHGISAFQQHVEEEKEKESL